MRPFDDGQESTKARHERIAIVDYPGHPFQLQLSRSLAISGRSVVHFYCPSVVSARGALDDEMLASLGLRVVPVPTRRPICRRGSLRRAVQEIEWGLRLIGRLRAARPSVLIVSNVPLLSLISVCIWSRLSRAKVVLWLQDLQSRAIARELSDLGFGGFLLPWVAYLLERTAANLATRIVVISESFADQLALWGVSTRKIATIENWAPVEELPECPKDNGWRSLYGISDDTQVVLYAGTLGYKHNPYLLVELARSLVSRQPKAILVVVSEGAGREILEEAMSSDPTLPLLCLDFQPYELLPRMLGSADVLVAILEESAGEYSVPSKVLTYLCAGRPILGIIPAANAAARVLREANAGLVISADNGTAIPKIAEGVEILLRDSRGPNVFGRAARQYAEIKFDIDSIRERFLDAVI